MNEKELAERYKSASLKILKVIEHPLTESTKDYIKRLNHAVALAVLELEKVNKKFLTKDIEQERKESYDLTMKLLKDEPPVLSNRKLKGFLQDKGVEFDRQGIVLSAAVALSKGAVEAGKYAQSRIKQVVKDLDKQGKGSVYGVAEALRNEFAESGLLNITYSNGVKQDITAYSMMLARTALTETSNLSVIGATLEHGHDLVYWHAVDNPCPICARYRDKVYSISGEDKRFPYLFDTMLDKGYFTVHPNDRCSLVPWIEKFYTGEEVKDIQQKSVIPKGDPRTEREKKAYAEAQAYNRKILIEKENMTQ